MFGLGPMEIGLVIFVFLFLFGPKKLPEIGQSLGQTIKNFRWSLKQVNQNDEGEEDHGKEETDKRS